MGVENELSAVNAEIFMFAWVFSAACPVNAAVWVEGLGRGVLFYENTVWHLRRGLQGDLMIESRNGTGFPGVDLALIKAAFVLQEFVVVIAGELNTSGDQR